MNKSEILKILGNRDCIFENENDSAWIISINAENLDVIITIPFNVFEVFYEARSKDGKIKLVDSHESYGDEYMDDFKEILMDIVDVIKNPTLRFTNKGKTLEAYGFSWYYFFGDFKVI